MRIREIISTAFAATLLFVAPAVRSDENDDSRVVLELFNSPPPPPPHPAPPPPPPPHGHPAPPPKVEHIDPRHRPFQVRGAASVFSVNPHARKDFDSDEPGSLSALVDGNAQTARYFTTFTGGYTDHDDFVFGAAVTIQPQGFLADPTGFGEIGFGLFDSKATGDNRTGDLNNSASNSFDTVELAYFANKSDLFGGPFLCPTVLGDALGSDAFANIGFSCSEVELVPGTPYFILVSHSASARTLSARVWQLDTKKNPTELIAARVTTDISTVTGFHVDSFGVSAYADGYASLAPSGDSIFAHTTWDMLVAGPNTAEDEVRDALNRVKLPQPKK